MDEAWLLEFPSLGDRVLGMVRDLRSARLIAAEAIMLALEGDASVGALLRAADIDIEVA